MFLTEPLQCNDQTFQVCFAHNTMFHNLIYERLAEVMDILQLCAVYHNLHWSTDSFTSNFCWLKSNLLDQFCQAGIANTGLFKAYLSFRVRTWSSLKTSSVSPTKRNNCRCPSLEEDPSKQNTFLDCRLLLGGGYRGSSIPPFEVVRAQAKEDWTHT